MRPHLRIEWTEVCIILKFNLLLHGTRYFQHGMSLQSNMRYALAGSIAHCSMVQGNPKLEYLHSLETVHYGGHFARLDIISEREKQ